MNDRRRTVGDIVAASARHAVTVAAAVVTVGLIARRLGPEALGGWALLGSGSFLLGVTDLGLSMSVQRAAAVQDPAPARRALALALLAIASLAPPAATLSYFFLLDVPGALPALIADIERAGVPAMTAGAVAALASPFRAFVIVRGRVRELAGAKVAASATQILILSVGLSLRETLVVPASAILAAAVVELSLTMRVARAIDPDLPLLPGWPTSWSEIAAPLRDGAAALAINLSTVVVARVDVLVLARFAPLAVVAGYGVGSRAVDQSYTFAKQVSAALMSKLGDPRAREGAVRLGTAIMGALVASGMAALSLDGRGLLTAWAGPVAAQPETALALALLGAAAVVSAAHEMVAATLFLIARSAWATAAPMVAGAIVNVAVLSVFVRGSCVWAVAGGTLAGNVLCGSVIWWRTRPLLRWTWRDVAHALAPLSAAGMASLVTGSALSGVGAAGVIGSVVACAVTTGVGLGAGGFVALRRRGTLAPDRKHGTMRPSSAAS